MPSWYTVLRREGILERGHSSAPRPPERDGGSLTWTSFNVGPSELLDSGWTVRSFREIRQQYIVAARSPGTERTSLDNPARPLIDFLVASSPLAVVGVSLRTAADLRDLYGYVVEPAYRRGLTLLVASDRTLAELDPADFADPIGYAWTLERLEYVASRFALGAGPDDLPPLTPIEMLLYRSMRERGLAPIAQYGIGKFRVDFAFADVRLAVECDGRQWHDPDRDARRDAVLGSKGWTVLHFSGADISHDAPACAARVVVEVTRRRATVESEQPEIAIPVRRSLRSRIIAWLRAHLSVPSRPTATLPARDVSERQVPTIVATSRAWVDGLDQEQREAALAHDGIVQVIAPAGSGKTTVLIARVRELLARGVAPNRILCCTFNAAAADELQARLHQAGVEGVEAATFHAVGRRILKRAELLRRNVAPMSTSQWRRLAKQAMDATPEGLWVDAPDARDRISDLKLGRMLTPEEFDQVAAGPAEQTLAKLYHLYEEQLEVADRNDFDDFIFRAVRLLQTDAAVRRHWQGEFTAVLVDEYQDIEPAQELLVQILAAPEDLLFCVGDEDQCLYAWRRAKVERVIELDQAYPGLERHALARNYRCPTAVVTASRGLIARNHRRFPKQILPGGVAQGEIKIVGATDLASQAAHAARLVKDLEQGEGVVLARTTRVLSEIAVGLAQAGIRFFGPERIKKRSGEPAVLLSYLRALGVPDTARPEDIDTIFRVPNRYLPDDLEHNLASALRSGQTFSRAVQRLRIPEPWRREKVLEGAALFDELSLVADAGHLIALLRTRGGLDRYFADAEQLNPTDQSAVDSLAHAQDVATGMGVVEFAGALDYEANIIEQHFDPKGIELATIHGAKGRQWPLVIVAGFEEGELPHARSMENADDPAGELEAERRLAYVAVTRASHRLLLLHTFGQPSRFIAEAALVAQTAPTTPLAEQLVRVAGVGIAPTTRAVRLGSSSGMEYEVDELLEERLESAPRVLVPAAGRAADGSIPCSLPGCKGVVRSDFVRAVAGGYAGLCPRYEVHEALVGADPTLTALWGQLAAVNEGAYRDWRTAQGGKRDLVGGALRCSVPGCGGIVKPEYVVEIDGEAGGVCGQRALHAALAAADPVAAGVLERFEDAARQARTDKYRETLTALGGIPCAVPGCRGVVGPAYVIDLEDGPSGICGMVAEHERLAESDGVARAAVDRYVSYRNARSRDAFGAGDDVYGEPDAW